MHFRIFFIFSALLYLHPAFGQFAIVADKDGYVNVRDAANSGDNVMDTLHDGRLVYMLDAENGWISVDYNLEDTSRVVDIFTNPG